MAIVSKRIEKLFPDSDLRNEETNVLMNTIKIPKNLLYLTDRLPKPRYIPVEDDKENLNITDGAEFPHQDALPQIPIKKMSKQKKYSRPHLAVNKYKEIADQEKIDKEYFYQANPSSLAQKYCEGEKISSSKKNQRLKRISDPNEMIREEENELGHPINKLTENKGKIKVSKEGSRKQYLENLLKNNSYLQRLPSKKSIAENSEVSNGQNNLSPLTRAEQILALHKKYD